MRTRAPVAGKKASFLPLPLDLHVLGLPLAFILSQDQTLHRCSVYIRPNDYRIRPRPRFSRSNSLLSFSTVALEDLNLLKTTFLHNISMNFHSCKNVSRTAPFPVLPLGQLPKRVQIYNCFLNRQPFLKKNIFSFPAPVKLQKTMNVAIPRTFPRNPYGYPSNGLQM